MQTMVADEATVALWELHKYERARSNGLISDEVYRANANMVLHDDNCYRCVPEKCRFCIVAS